MSDQSPYDASTGGLSRLADSVKQRRTDEYVRRLEADRDRLAAELAALKEDHRDAARNAGLYAEEAGELRAELAQARAALKAARWFMADSRRLKLPRDYSPETADKFAALERATDSAGGNRAD